MLVARVVGVRRYAHASRQKLGSRRGDCEAVLTALDPEADMVEMSAESCGPRPQPAPRRSGNPRPTWLALPRCRCVLCATGRESCAAPLFGSAGRLWSTPASNRLTIPSRPQSCLKLFSSSCGQAQAELDEIAPGNLAAAAISDRCFPGPAIAAPARTSIPYCSARGSSSGRAFLSEGRCRPSPWGRRRSCRACAQSARSDRSACRKKHGPHAESRTPWAEECRWRTAPARQAIRHIDTLPARANALARNSLPPGCQSASAVRKYSSAQLGRFGGRASPQPGYINLPMQREAFKARGLRPQVSSSAVNMIETQGRLGEGASEPIGDASSAGGTRPRVALALHSRENWRYLSPVRAHPMKKSARTFVLVHPPRCRYRKYALPARKAAGRGISAKSSFSSLQYFVAPSLRIDILVKFPHRQSH